MLFYQTIWCAIFLNINSSSMSQEQEDGLVNTDNDATVDNNSIRTHLNKESHQYFDKNDDRSDTSSNKLKNPKILCQNNLSLRKKEFSKDFEFDYYKIELFTNKTEYIALEDIYYGMEEILEGHYSEKEFLEEREIWYGDETCSHHIDQLLVSSLEVIKGEMIDKKQSENKKSTKTFEMQKEKDLLSLFVLIELKINQKHIQKNGELDERVYYDMVSHFSYLVMLYRENLNSWNSLRDILNYFKDIYRLCIAHLEIVKAIQHTFPARRNPFSNLKALPMTLEKANYFVEDFINFFNLKNFNDFLIQINDFRCASKIRHEIIEFNKVEKIFELKKRMSSYENRLSTWADNYNYCNHTLEKIYKKFDITYKELKTDISNIFEMKAHLSKEIIFLNISCTKNFDKEKEAMKKMDRILWICLLTYLNAEKKILQITFERIYAFKTQRKFYLNLIITETKIFTGIYYNLKDKLFLESTLSPEISDFYKQRLSFIIKSELIKGSINSNTDVIYKKRHKTMIKDLLTKMCFNQHSLLYILKIANGVNTNTDIFKKCVKFLRIIIDALKALIFYSFSERKSNRLDIRYYNGNKTLRRILDKNNLRAICDTYALKSEVESFLCVLNAEMKEMFDANIDFGTIIDNDLEDGLKPLYKILEIFEDINLVEDYFSEIWKIILDQKGEFSPESIRQNVYGLTIAHARFKDIKNRIHNLQKLFTFSKLSNFIDDTELKSLFLDLSKIAHDAIYKSHAIVLENCFNIYNNSEIGTVSEINSKLNNIHSASVMSKTWFKFLMCCDIYSNEIINSEMMKDKKIDKYCNGPLDHVNINNILEINTKNQEHFHETKRVKIDNENRTDFKSIKYLLIMEPNSFIYLFKTVVDEFVQKFYDNDTFEKYKNKAANVYYSFSKITLNGINTEHESIDDLIDMFSAFLEILKKVLLKSQPNNDKLLLEYANSYKFLLDIIECLPLSLKGSIENQNDHKSLLNYFTALISKQIEGTERMIQSIIDRPNLVTLDQHFTSLACIAPLIHVNKILNSKKKNNEIERSIDAYSKIDAYTNMTQYFIKILFCNYPSVSNDWEVRTLCDFEEVVTKYTNICINIMQANVSKTTDQTENTKNILENVRNCVSKGFKEIIAKEIRIEKSVYDLLVICMTSTDRHELKKLILKSVRESNQTEIRKQMIFILNKINFFQSQEGSNIDEALNIFNMMVNYHDNYNNSYSILLDLCVHTIKYKKMIKMIDLFQKVMFKKLKNENRFDNIEIYNSWLDLATKIQKFTEKFPYYSKLNLKFELQKFWLIHLGVRYFGIAECSVDIEEGEKIMGCISNITSSVNTKRYISDFVKAYLSKQCQHSYFHNFSKVKLFLNNLMCQMDKKSSFFLLLNSFESFEFKLIEASISLDNLLILIRDRITALRESIIDTDESSDCLVLMERIKTLQHFQQVLIEKNASSNDLCKKENDAQSSVMYKKLIEKYYDMCIDTINNAYRSRTHLYSKAFNNNAKDKIDIIASCDGEFNDLYGKSAYLNLQNELKKVAIFVNNIIDFQRMHAYECANNLQKYRDAIHDILDENNKILRELEGNNKITLACESMQERLYFDTIIHNIERTYNKKFFYLLKNDIMLAYSEEDLDKHIKKGEKYLNNVKYSIETYNFAQKNPGDIDKIISYLDNSTKQNILPLIESSRQSIIANSPTKKDCYKLVELNISKTDFLNNVEFSMSSNNLSSLKGITYEKDYRFELLLNDLCVIYNNDIQKNIEQPLELDKLKQTVKNNCIEIAELNDSILYLHLSDKYYDKEPEIDTLLQSSFMYCEYSDIKKYWIKYTAKLIKLLYDNYQQVRAINALTSNKQSIAYNEDVLLAYESFFLMYKAALCLQSKREELNVEISKAIKEPINNNNSEKYKKLRKILGLINICAKFLSDMTIIITSEYANDTDLLNGLLHMRSEYLIIGIKFRKADLLKLSFANTKDFWRLRETLEKFDSVAFLEGYKEFLNSKYA